jgi:hypothetical protein
MSAQDERTVVSDRQQANSLGARRLGIDTQYEAIVFMHKDCPVCRSEGFTAHTRVLLCAAERQVIATLHQVTSDLISHEEAALSESAWLRLALRDGDRELCGNLGDDVWLKAAYRGGCRACQNLPKGAIRHVERYHRHPVPSA